MTQRTGLVALEAASAEITTASVTIRTLRVNSRQLTMGTFRQLPKRAMVDERKIELLGTVWGWVNYDSEPKHQNFVVQFGEELCRCDFKIREVAHHNVAEWPGELFMEEEAFESDAAGYVLAAASLGNPEGLEVGKFGQTPYIRLKKDRPFFGMHYLKIGYQRTFSDSDADYIRSSFTGSQGAYRHHFSAMLEKMHPGHANDSLSDWDARLDQTDRDIVDYAQRWKALMGRLRTVKQLFIAT